MSGGEPLTIDDEATSIPRSLPRLADPSIGFASAQLGVPAGVNAESVHLVEWGARCVLGSRLPHRAEITGRCSPTNLRIAA